MLLADAEEELLFSQDRLFLYTLSSAGCALPSIIHKCIVYSYPAEKSAPLHTNMCLLYPTQHREATALVCTVAPALCHNNRKCYHYST